MRVQSESRRERIVLEHLSLVKAIAIRVHESLPVHVDLDDLVHAGVLGLMDAVTKYRPEKKVVFRSYAKHRIKGAILDSLRQLDWASRDLRKRQRQVDALTHELAAKYGRAPTETEIARGLGVDLQRWRRMATELRNVGLLSASTRGPDPDAPVPEFPGRADWEPDHICCRRQMHVALDSAIKTLPARYQKVVFLYYSNELTMKQIGNILGVNESRVSQIHKTALARMALALHSAGIHDSGAF